MGKVLKNLILCKEYGIIYISSEIHMAKQRRFNVMDELRDKFGLAHLLDVFQIDELILLIPKLLCAVWIGINALCLRGIWVNMAETIVNLIPLSVATSTTIMRIIKLAGWLGLMLIAVIDNDTKWIKWITYSTGSRLVIEVIINGITAIMSGGAWKIPGIGGAIVLILSALAVRAVNKALTKKKKE